MLAAVVAGTAIIFAAVILDAKVRMGEFKQIQSFNSERCELLTSDIFNERGAEDLILWKKGVIFSGLDDRFTLCANVTGGPSNTKRGDMLILDSRSEPVQLSIVPLDNFPSNITFHPHGLFADRKLNLLYVINHGYHEGGERIEVFQVLEDAKTGAFQLQFSHVLTHPDFNTFAMGHLNDLVVLGDDLYVTVYLTYPDSVHGGHDYQESILHPYRPLANDLWKMFGKGTFFFHCKLHSDRQSLTACHIHPHRFGMANGVTTDLDGKRLLFVDIPRSQLIVFDRHQQTGELILRQTVDLHHSFDNIELDTESGHWTVGAIPRIADSALVQAGHPTALSWGGSMRLKHDAQSDTFVLEDLVIHNGSKLSGISSAVWDANFVYHGSFLREGILRCPVEL